MSDNQPPKDNLFQTPDPAELKRMAQEDPIPERESAHEAADVMDQDADRESLGLDDGQAIDSIILKANLSGH